MPFTSPLCPTCGQRIPPEPKPVAKFFCGLPESAPCHEVRENRVKRHD